MDYREQSDNTNREIHEKLAILQRISKRCVAEKRLPDDDEKREGLRLLDEIDKTEKERWERDNTAPLPGSATKDSWWRKSEREPDRPALGNVPFASETQTNRALTGSDINYRNLFGSPANGNGFDSFPEFLRAVAGNRHDDRLITRTQNIGTPSDGGFMVPEPMAAAIMDMALEKSLFWKKSTVYPMTSSTLKVPAINDTDHSASRGGLVALWKAEAAEFDLDSIDLRQLEFSARKLTLLIKCTREFLEDGKAAEQFVKNTMAAEMAWQLDHVFLSSGSGAGMPMSVLNSPALVTVAKESGQAADTLIWNNITDMSKAFNPASSDSGLWIISPSLRDQVWEMNLAIGTGGSSVHPDPSQVQERGLSLLGFPVKFSEHCSYAGDVGDIFLVNPKSYAVALRSDVRLEASSHVAFTSDQVVYKATMRCDGMPIMASPLTLADGTSEVSDFVTLAERA